MKLSVAPAFPIWLIVVLVVITVSLRLAAVVQLRRRRGRLPGSDAWMRFGLAVAAVLFLGLAALRIGDESEAERPPRPASTAEESNVNVFLVVDRSLATEAQDFGGSSERLEGMRDDMQVVLEKYPKARFSVISYAGSARIEWPLSPDVWSLIPFVGQFTPYGGEYDMDDERQPDVNVNASSSLLEEDLNKGVHEYPGSANLVYLFGSSSDTNDAEFDIPKGLVSGGAVFGYGTEEGATAYFTDESGEFQTVDYKLNEAALQSAADSLGVPYEQRDRGVVSEDSLASAVPQAAPVDDVVGDVPHPNRIEFYWLFTALAAALFGWELYGLTRHWLRRGTPGARR